MNIPRTTSAPQTTRRGALRVVVTRLVGLAGVLMALGASDARATGNERMVVELRVIEGTPGTGNGKQVVDPRLSAFARDLRALPFSEIKLLDVHKSSVREGERISVELPQPALKKRGPVGKRFLQVAAHGRQPGGKLRFQLSIEALRFDTLVAVPDGGTIVVAVPKSTGRAMLVAFTARQQ